MINFSNYECEFLQNIMLLANFISEYSKDYHLVEK